ncbi:Trm112 family protein [Candidatus Erwinia haradaeae]|uniref:UPF0434 protein YcaR n=1 Tax=Candidatus Erwinia haradaeae TaxID=1922217 RepID=A0A451DAJ4_9GAMM|nr:Trm112 family protein [Candidatus Erwinia haradaeae]VFP83313.1 UPF0434 protein YcaR [Candidatus Erwinia haradaeae]
MHPLLLDLIVCPICHKSLLLSHTQTNWQLICQFDMMSYPIREGIPILLTDKASAIPKT